MSNEIEIGEYVRTKTGYIGKIVGRHGGYGLHYELDLKKEIQDNFMNGIVREDNIVKHSKNVIDLIEEGDYVNGMEIDEFDDEEGNLFLGIPIYDDSLMDCIEEVRPLSIIEIKSILTKEQYEQNCYKVKK